MAILMRRKLVVMRGADFEEFEAYGAAGGVGELAVPEGDAPEGVDQHIGESGEPEPELVGAQAGGGGAIGKEVELLLLDPVLHLAACAVDLLIKHTSR